ncbi:major facilitator superfamily domain-containing protein [Geopyxis carbonaria]|nr:major facilitator superfamily domain-containing protein [Geopyxis carbonaria]
MDDQEKRIDDLERGTATTSASASIHNDSVTGGVTEKPILLMLNDEEDPLKWPASKKWLFTLIICLNSFVVSMGSSIFTPGIPGIAATFNATTVVATLGFSMFVLGFAFGPVIFAPLSEIYGRIVVFRWTWALFFVFQLPTALAKNITTLIVGRLLAGTFGSPALTVAGGTMADIWDPSELGPPLGVFSLTAFLGPVAGPIIGGFVTQYATHTDLDSWRWNFWILFALTGVLGINFVWLPETRRSVLLHRKALRLGLPPPSAAPQSELYRAAILRPITLLCRDPVVLLVSVYTAFLFGILYLFFGAYPRIFGAVYHFTPSKSGLAFLGIGFGVLLSLPASHFSQKAYLRLQPTHGPEARLPPAILAATLVPVAMFWFAWTARAETHVHWIVPILSGVPFGLSFVVVFISCVTYLAECYMEQAASVTASNTIVRSLLGMAFPLFGTRMYDALTPEWAGTLLGCVALAFVPVPWLFWKYGKVIRGARLGGKM